MQRNPTEKILCWIPFSLLIIIAAFHLEYPSLMSLSYLFLNCILKQGIQGKNELDQANPQSDMILSDYSVSPLLTYGLCGLNYSTFTRSGGNNIICGYSCIFSVSQFCKYFFKRTLSKTFIISYAKHSLSFVFKSTDVDLTIATYLWT